MAGFFVVQRKSLLTLLVSILIAGVFMWWALQGLDVNAVSGYFIQADLRYVLLAAFFGLLAYWLRAVRWNILLEPMGYKVKSTNALWSISFGYLMNLTIPRSGEIARATALYGTDKVPADRSFGTIILERVVDLLCMVMFLVFVLVFRYEAIFSFYKYANVERNPNIGGLQWLIPAVLVGALLGGIVFIWFRNRFTNIPILGKLYALYDGVMDGLTAIARLKRPIAFVIYTIAIWVCYFLASYIVCFSLPQTSDFQLADGLFLLVVGTLGMIIPASGGIGAFHLAMKIGVGALFISQGKDMHEGFAVGLAYGFISHTLQLFLFLLMGFLSIPFLAKARNSANLQQSQFQE